MCKTYTHTYPHLQSASTALAPDALGVEGEGGVLWSRQVSTVGLSVFFDNGIEEFLHILTRLARCLKQSSTNLLGMSHQSQETEALLKDFIKASRLIQAKNSSFSAVAVL